MGPYDKADSRSAERHRRCRGVSRCYAGGLDARTLASSTAAVQRDAALYRIAIIGEAVTHLPAEVRALAPEIPWDQIKNMRQHIVHAYWQVDFAIVAETIAVDLVPLKAAANRLIALIERTNP